MIEEAAVARREAAQPGPVVEAIVAAAVAGDVDGFLDRLEALAWPGAWRELFEAVVRIPAECVPDRIRDAFHAVWRPTDQTGQARFSDFAILNDLGGRNDLFLRALRVLALPVPLDELPLAIFRGQSLPDHHCGRDGVWWTPYPRFAEWYARSTRWPQAGQGVVLISILPPPEAIITRRGLGEILVDPGLLDFIDILDVPPPYAPAEEGVPELRATSRLNHVPTGYTAGTVPEWRRLAQPTYTL